jgi:hypothetical protein
VEEITMKKPKMVADMLGVADTCIEASKAQARLLESRGKGPSKKKRDDRGVNTTNQETTRTAEIMSIMASNPLLRNKRGLFVALMTQRSGVRSIVPQDTIWKSVKLFWIGRRCHCQQRRCHNMPVGVNITQRILLTTMSRWGRSM